MTVFLSDIISDNRLERLFSSQERDCALQLWILQIKTGEGIENRFIYGRLLPYSHSSNVWNATRHDHFEQHEECHVQIVRLSLYIKSSATADLLKYLSDGHDLIRISEQMNLALSSDLATRFGKATIGTLLICRPVAYLLNRDAANSNQMPSPHGGAGAFSASLSQTDKPALFRIEEDFNNTLAKFIVAQLNLDTGLDFSGRDLERLGDLELLVFPTLDDCERELLTANWKDQSGFRVRLNPVQLPHYNKFHVRLCATNDGQLIYSGLATAECVGSSEVDCEFDIPANLRPIVDSTEVEIYGSKIGDGRVSTLCCRWQMSYIREVFINGSLAGNRGGGSVQLGWLEKVTKSPAASNRLKAVQTINQGNEGFSSHVGDRAADPWVPINRDLRSLFSRLLPPSSEGRFFDRLSESGGLGRLEFVEWIKSLLIKHQNHQVLIFDPYFEDAGIGLVVPNAGKEGDYVIFTTLPKPPKQESWRMQLWRRLKGCVVQEKNQLPAKDRINNMLASCEQLKSLLRSVRLRVYGLKSGALHDRYILIVGKDGLPVSGFNVSNSIQKANENYPLLITPIPPDVLPRVLKYASELLIQASSPPIADDPECDSKIELIFDSSSVPKTLRKRYEPLRLLDKSFAGDVLSGWTGEQSLHGLKGNALKQRMSELGLLDKESLAFEHENGLRNCLIQQKGNFSNFGPLWDVLGELLANTASGDLLRTAELSTETNFLNFLIDFLSDAFNRVHAEEVDASIACIASSYFQDPVEMLMKSSSKPHHFFHGVKYSVLTWPEYFAVKILWMNHPVALISIAESQAANLPAESHKTDAVKLSLLSQVVSEIALGVEFELSNSQRDALINSSNGLLKWMGLNSLELQLKKSNGVPYVTQYLSAFDHCERIKILGWMANHFANQVDTNLIFIDLVNALHKFMPQKIDKEDASLLVDSLRGHMRTFGWCEPWLFQDVIKPLMDSARISTDDLSSIWTKELLLYLGGAVESKSTIFQRRKEGRVTEVTAYMFANSSLQQQRIVLSSLSGILQKAKRDIQQPLASTLNWTKWNTSLEIAMWIFAFTKWASYFSVESSEIGVELQRFSNEVRAIALTRSVEEWKSDHGVEPAAFALFIEEIGEI